MIENHYKKRSDPGRTAFERDRRKIMRSKSREKRLDQISQDISDLNSNYFDDVNNNNNSQQLRDCSENNNNYLGNSSMQIDVSNNKEVSLDRKINELRQLINLRLIVF